MKKKNSLFWIYGEIYLTHWFPIDARRFRFWNWVQFYAHEVGEKEWRTLPDQMHKEYPFKKNKS